MLSLQPDLIEIILWNSELISSSFLLEPPKNANSQDLAVPRDDSLESGYRGVSSINVTSEYTRRMYWLQCVRNNTGSTDRDTAE
jgi:hypothetical protein